MRQYIYTRSLTEYTCAFQSGHQLRGQSEAPSSERRPLCLNCIIFPFIEVFRSTDAVCASALQQVLSLSPSTALSLSTEEERLRVWVSVCVAVIGDREWGFIVLAWCWRGGRETEWTCVFQFSVCMYSCVCVRVCVLQCTRRVFSETRTTHTHKQRGGERRV